MTNYEAISASLYPYDVDGILIEKVGIDEGVDVRAEYSVADKIGVAKTVIGVLRQLIVLSEESNGGYSAGYSTDGLKKRIHDLAKENGLSDIAEEFNASPTIEFLSY